MSNTASSKEKTRVVKTVLENSSGEVLVLEDSTRESWELPGGKIRENEDRYQASERELREETGLESGKNSDLVRIELEDDGIIECFVLEAEEFSGEINLSDEHSRSKWLPRDQLNSIEWHREAEYNLPVLRYLEEYRKSESNYGKGKTIEVVKLLIQNSEGKFLAVRKTNQEKVSGGETYKLYGRMAGKWELPGGRIEKEENRFEAARKEIMEELGIELGDIVDVVREAVEEENNVDTWILFSDEFDGEIDLSKEHDDFRWVSPEQYAELDWHQDAGYGLAPMKHIQTYLK